MLPPDLLSLLVCPETHQDIALASPEEVDRLNQAIGRGEIRNAGGAPVDQPVQGALIRADQTIAYPIRDGIPIMLVAEGLVLRPTPLQVHG